MLEWVTISYSRRSPNPGTKPASLVGRWIHYHCSTWEAQKTLNIRPRDCHTKWSKSDKARPFLSGNSRTSRESQKNCIRADNPSPTERGTLELAPRREVDTGTLDGNWEWGNWEWGSTEWEGPGLKTQGTWESNWGESHKGWRLSKVPTGTSSSQGETRLETIISSAWA